MAEAKRILASFLTQEQEFQRLQAEDAKQTAAREGLALLAAAGTAGDTGRIILEQVLAEGDFLAVRVMR